MSQTEVQLIKDAVIVNADISGSAAIDVSKISGALPAAGGTITGDVTFDGETAGRDIVFDRSDNALEFLDDAKATFGTGADCSLVHSGADFAITNSTGNLNILCNSSQAINLRHGSENMIRAITDGAVELYYDNNKKFETLSGGVQITGGMNLSGNASFGDNNIAKFGASDDLQIYHDSSTPQNLINSYTSNPLTIMSNGDTSIKSNNDENMGVFKKNGAVELYYDNSKKFETTSNGISVGSVTIDSAFNNIGLPDGGAARFGTGEDLKIYHDGSDSYINDTGTGHLNIVASQVNILNAAANEAIAKFIQDGAVELYHDNSKKFHTTTSGAQITGHLFMDDNNKIRLGNSQDLEIYHDGSNSYVSDTSTGNLKLTSNGTAVQIEKSDGENMAIFRTDGAVELYHNNSKKLETTANGFNTQGSGQVEFIIGSTNAGGAVLYLDGDSDGDASGGANYAYIYHNTAGALLIRNRVDNAIHLGTNDTERWYVYNTGHFVPAANNTYDIGTSSVRVRNIYTNDLNLSNEGSSNSIDGTWGSYTIQEGSEDLFLINKRNGKKYKFNLTEVS